MLRNKSRDYSEGNLGRVRHLRNEMTDGEKILWSRLRAKRLGFQFWRQYPIGPYVLDFYCPEAMLCVEVDGEQHLPDKDARRDEYLLAQGIETFRIQSLTLFQDGRLQYHVDNILEVCVRRSGRSPFEDSSGTAP